MSSKKKINETLSNLPLQKMHNSQTSALSQSIFPNSEVFILHNFISSSCASQHHFLFSFFMDNQQLILTFNFSWTSSYFSWTFPQQWSFESIWSFRSSPHHFTLLLSMRFFFPPQQNHMSRISLIKIKNKWKFNLMF